MEWQTERIIEFGIWTNLLSLTVAGFVQLTGEKGSTQ